MVIQDCWSYTCCFSWSLVSSSAILSLSVDITWEYVYLSWLNWCHSNGCMIFLAPCSNIFFFITVRLRNSLADKWFSLNGSKFSVVRYLLFLDCFLISFLICFWSVLSTFCHDPMPCCNCSTFHAMIAN